MDFYIILIIVIFLFIFACIKEYSEQKNAYQFNNINKSDELHTIVKKIRECMKIEVYTIKWRRIFIATILLILCIHLFIKPVSKEEFILYFFFTFTIFYVNWQSYVKMTSVEAIDYGNKNINLFLKKLIKRVQELPGYEQQYVKRMLRSMKEM